MHDIAMLTLPKYMNPWHVDTSLVVNAYAPAGHELELPQWKYKRPGAILSHFRSQAIKIKTASPVHFSHCLGRNGEGTIERTGPSQVQTFRNTLHLRPVPFQFQYFHRRGLSQILNCSIFFFSLHSVSSTSVSMYWFQITLYIYLFIYIFIYNLYQN